MSKGTHFSSGIIVRDHPKGWMDENRILDWLKNVWAKGKGEVVKKPLLHIWHAFEARPSEKIKQLFSEMGSSVAM